MATPITTTATTTKTAITSAALNARLITAANQASATTANQVQNQGSAGNTKTNPPQGFEGPSTGIPSLNKTSADSLAPKAAADRQASVDQAMGLVSKTDALKSLAGVGTTSTAASSAKDKLTDLAGSSKTDKPASDQGFGSATTTLSGNPVASRPTTGATSQGTASNDKGGGVTTFGTGGGSGSSQSAVSKSSSSGAVFNPMDQFRGGSVGGPLAAAAAEGKKTLADFDNRKSMAGVFVEGTWVPDHKDASAILSNSAAAASALAGILAPTPLAEVAAFLGASAGAMYLGSVAIDNYYYEEDLQKELESKASGGAGMPNPENTGSNVNVLTQSLLDQLNASKAGKPANQGGSGDVTPVREAGVDAVGRNGSIAVNAASVQGRNLFGQPGGAALGENVSGGNKGLNGFSGSTGAGVINPGNEAGSLSGDPRFQQDPGAALGGRKPTLAPPELNGTANGSQTSASEQSSSVSATLAASIRNITLTGGAAINGSGNNLDNLITGNGAANELRGEAGDDSLDGKAGNDLLDGGAGRDVLTGGLGADRFRFATAAAFGTAQADRITDFSRSEGDRIELSRSAFGLSAVTTLSFQTVNNDAELTRALGSSSLLVQDLRDGSLFFNQNGTAAGAGQGGVFAVVSQGLSLQGSDFALVA